MGFINNPDTFWAKVNKLPAPHCWLYTGTIDSNGRGVLSYQGRRVKAHRLAFELARGPIPQGMCICHVCDNRRCCNPDHFFLGTLSDNNRDCVAKGRNPGNRKVTPQIVRTIRHLSDKGQCHTRQMATALGITPEQVRNIMRRKQWKHV